MIWFKKKEKDAGLCSFLEINDRILVQYRGIRTYTIVEDMADDQIFVSVPRDNDSSSRLRSGETVMIALPDAKGLRSFKTSVVGYTVERVPLLILGNFKLIGVCEQRHTTRLAKRIVIDYRKVNNDSTCGHWLHGMTRNIAAGGLNFGGEHIDLMKVGDELEIDMSLPGQDPIHAICRVAQVVMPKKGVYQSEVGVSFTSISDSDLVRIARYVSRRLSDIGFERRAMDRIRLDPFLRVRLVPGDADGFNEIIGAAEDLSLGGMRLWFPTSEDLMIGQTMTIEVTVSDKQVKMTCEVVWITSQHTALGDTQRMGVKFTSLSEPGYKVIKQFYSKFKTQG